MEELYPFHYKALKTVGLTPKVPPTLRQIRKRLKMSLQMKREREMKNARRKNSRQTYFCVGVNKVFKGKNAIHITIKRLRDKYNLKWLRVSMSYHKFPNLGKIFGGDLSGKLMREVKSVDFMDRPCNCSVVSKVDGKCIFGDNCRKSIVVYKCECTICGKFYIGNTQNHVKKRMNGHYAETRNSVNKGIISDSFAKHFSKHFKNDGLDKSGQISSKDVREITRVSILWQGNPISSMKTFGRVNCNLCMMERLEILKAERLID